MTSILTSLAVGNLLATIALGQAQSVPSLASKSDWGSLRALIAGAEIRVMATGHEVIRGTFREVNDDALIVDQTSGETMLPRSSVISVSLKKQSRRIGYVSIGAIAGAVTGVLVDWPPRCCYGVSSKVISTPLGALNGGSNWGGDPDGGLAGDVSDAMNFGLETSGKPARKGKM